ncbi:sugar transferase [Nodosilinea sp. FACHB-131]|nr:sugar transferase [Nodosilinea sp. FACHB-131]
MSLSAWPPGTRSWGCRWRLQPWRRSRFKRCRLLAPFARFPVFWASLRDRAHCPIVLTQPEVVSVQTYFETRSLAQWTLIEQARLDQRQGIKFQLALKRLLDVVLAAVGVVMIAPLLVAIAIAVRLSSPGPILFIQERMGKFGQPFYIYKFRTMVDGAIHFGAGINTFEGDPRITAVGKILRDYHLDELPQLFNVLRGEMSLVGPRPLLMSALKTYTPQQQQRLLMLPGMTAWEAVKGGLDNSLNDRLRLDVWYVEKWSLGLDLWILLLTIPVVLRKEGIYEQRDIELP